MIFVASPVFPPQIALALLVAAIFWKSESLTAITYFVMLFTLGSSMELGDVVPPPYPLTLIMFPPTNYIRSLRLCLKYRHETESVSMAELMTESEKDEWRNLMLCQFFIPVLMLFLSIGLLMDYHLKLLHAVQLRWSRWRTARRGGGSPKNSTGSTEIGKATLEKSDCHEEDRLARLSRTDYLDDDVAAEQDRVGRASNDQDAIQVHQVRKRYPGGTVAVDGVSFGVPRGQCFGLLGPNGAGKTSTINMMCGMQRITGGQILLNRAGPQVGGAAGGQSIDLARDLTKAYFFSLSFLKKDVRRLL